MKGRDHFLVLEGINKGRQVSCWAKSPTTSYLVTGLTHLPAGQVTFDLKRQTLKIPLHAPINAFSGYGGIFTAVKAGTYRLAIPAFPSKATRSQYSKWTRFHKSWFRIGLDVGQDRFLHGGQISEGCVTVRQFAYDGKPETKLPDGFSDLPGFAHGPLHGWVGLPQPAHPTPVASWDDVYRYLILRRDGDQSVGKPIVTDGGHR